MKNQDVEKETFLRFVGEIGQLRVKVIQLEVQNKYLLEENKKLKEQREEEE